MESLYDAVSGIYDITIEEVTDGPLDDLALRLDACMRAQAKLKDLTDALKMQMVEAMPANDMPIQGVGILHRKNKPSKTLRDKASSSRMREDIAVAVARDVAEDRFTGEVDADKRRAIYEGIKRAWDVIPSFSVMKHKAALELGLDQDTYTETSWFTTVEIEAEGEPS